MKDKKCMYARVMVGWCEVPWCLTHDKHIKWGETKCEKGK